MKRVIIWIISILILLFLIHISLKGIFWNIDYIKTFQTKYTNLDSTKLITTKDFRIETPKNWWHIFNCIGEEGESVGSFITPNGVMEYEYGIFSNSFEVDSIFVFQRDSIIINRFLIYVAKNEQGETAIHIPVQNEMTFGFSFFMSKACSENIDELIVAIKNIEFKK